MKLDDTEYNSAVPCDRGEFYNSASNTCDSCPVNEYNDEIGSTACLPCPDGKVTPRVGSSNQNNCVSPAGINLSTFCFYFFDFLLDHYSSGFILVIALCSEI